MKGEVQQHYDTLLAEHYTWMFGFAFEDKVAEQEALLRAAGVAAPGRALDLGAGSGFQSFALAALGATEIVALDTCAALLREIEMQRADEAIRCIEADLRTFDRHVKGTFNTIVCMGDTLTHLTDSLEVKNLFQLVYSRLTPGGRFVVSYRDLAAAPQGLDRFIPLRSDDNTIMTCFLERVAPDKILVHDLVHVRRDGAWRLNKSAYPKLALPRDEVLRVAACAGLNIDYEGAARGMEVLAWRRG